jgi:tetratricopeptide (TPR) repeat protein
MAGDNHFLSLRLQGVDCNRDAIGARVELELPNSSGEKLVRSLRAGQGYLSQTSKWLHFGIGEKTSIPRITVHWPGGKSESMDIPEVDSFYTIVQGTGCARLVQRPLRTIRVTAAQSSDHVTSSASAVVLPERILIPHLKYENIEGRQITIGAPSSQPRLVNLWASWCQPCLAELQEFGERADDIRKAGVRVDALSVDRLSDDSFSTDQITATLDRLGYPFEAGTASQSLLDQVQILSDVLFYDNTALPVPTSFLLDKKGRLAAIYRGPVSADRLLEDVALLPLEEPELAEAALVAPGKWHQAPAKLTLSPLVEELRLAGYVDAAVQFATDNERAMEGEETWAVVANRLGKELGQQGKLKAAERWFRTAIERQPNLALAHANLGAVLEGQGKSEAAAVAFRDTVIRNPGDLVAHESLVRVLEQLNRTDQVMTHLRKVLDNRIPLPGSRLKLATLLHQNDRPKQAAELYRALLEDSPKHLMACNNLAWLLATCPDNQVRDGAAAVQFAERTKEIVAKDNAAVFGTLAAAYAENGQFDQAVTSAERAISLVKDGTELAKQLRLQLESYQAKKAWRESSN